MVAGLALALGLGACSLSFPIAPLVDPAEVTGSIGGAQSPMAGAVGWDDWAFAEPALTAALDGTAAPEASWSNVASRASGRFRAVGAAVPGPDGACRAFLAEVGGGGSPRWFEGTACRKPGAAWRVRDVRPWSMPS
jgi:hypothetical protein